MSLTKKVSIIIPVYNVEEYLKECIESVCNQTFENLEIIIVNDGSTDNSLSICQRYAHEDSRIILINKKNGGLSDARNSGLKIATGEYIYFLDSDDYISPETIEILYKTAEQEKVDFINFDAHAFIDELNPLQNNSKNVQNQYIKQNSYYGVMLGYELYQKQIKNGDYRSSVPMCFYNHKFLKKYNLSFYNGILHEDELFTFLAFMYAKRVFYVPLAFYHRRVRIGSIMGQSIKEKNLIGMYNVLKQIFNHEEFADLNSETRDAYLDGVSSLFDTYFYRYCLVGKKKKYTKKQFNEILSILSDKDYFKSYNLKKHVKSRFKIRTKAFINKYSTLKKLKKYIGPLYFKNKLKIKYMFSKNNETIKQLHNSINEEKRFIILCVADHGNRGDHVIDYSQICLIKKYYPESTIIEISISLCEFNSKKIVKYLKSDDIFIVCGGGWFGSLWRHAELAACKVLKHFKNSHIIIMPQTIYYSDNSKGKKEFLHDKKFFSKLTDLQVYVREKKSYDFCKKNELFFNSKSLKMIPDMVASLDFQNFASSNRSGVTVCLRSDPEAVINNDKKILICKKLLNKFSKVRYISTNQPGEPLNSSNRFDGLKKVIEQIASSECVVTDRLHCMLLAAISGTPCVAFDNLTHKVYGVYSWIDFCDYITICDNDSEFLKKLEKVISVEHIWNSKKIENYFEELAKNLK